MKTISLGGLRPDAKRDLGLKQTYDLLWNLLKKGWADQYNEPETNILISTPIGGKECPKQLAHYDYHLTGIKKKHAMPYSALTAVDGDATSITLILEIGENLYQELVVPLLPGDMIIWGGSILHHGRPYALPNMRMFVYFSTENHPPKDSLLMNKVPLNIVKS